MATAAAVAAQPVVAPTESPSKTYPWLNMNELAAEKVGGQVLHCTDQFFAPASWLLKEGRGEFIPGKFTEFGQYMEGWETRRHNPNPDDSAIIRLGLSGIIHGVDIDTNHFTGNFGPEASVEALSFEGDPPLDSLLKAKWTEILPKSRLNPGTPSLGHTYFTIGSKERWTHLRLRMFPDGGIARFRVYGVVVPNWNLYEKDEIINLLAIENGAVAVSCSDMYFSHKDHLIMPGRGKNMGDGWETKRRRGPGYDWCILKFGWKGTVKRVLVDTNHFKGNYPDACTLEGAVLNDDDVPETSTKWQTIVERTKLQPHKEHYFTELKQPGPFTHVRINIFPDGGVSRLRVFGRRVFE